jgi:hypothetical protein
MQQRKQVETGMNSLRELMRKLNLQADARAKLNVKKSQQREREETYRARYVHYRTTRLFLSCVSDSAPSSPCIDIRASRPISRQCWVRR